MAGDVQASRTTNKNEVLVQVCIFNGNGTGHTSVMVLLCRRTSRLTAERTE